MSHKMLRPFIFNMSILGYFPLLVKHIELTCVSIYLKLSYEELFLIILDNFEPILLK